MSSYPIICAICYEEAKPASEDLQSISICGHVFHELCLQQWLEYCPRGRKPTCPLCKQHCSSNDVHRLFFQSAAELTQAKISPYSEAQTPKVLQETIQKLEGQLSTSKQALAAHQQHLTELQSQLSAYAGRVEKAEAAQAEAKRETSTCKESLLRVQEEVRRSNADRCRLLEKNTSMAKDLATYKLMQELELDKDEVLKLASMGRETNKDDVIDTLSRSLVIRNRTYKELMTKCNELGMCESRALRKCEKAFELIKRLKARVQELEHDKEKKVSSALRSMKRPCTDFHMKSETQINVSKESRSSLDKIHQVEPFSVPQRGREALPLVVSDQSTAGDQPVYLNLDTEVSLYEEKNISHNDINLNRKEGRDHINIAEKMAGNQTSAGAMLVLEESKCYYELPRKDCNNENEPSSETALGSNTLSYNSTRDTCLSRPNEVVLIEDSLENSSLPFPIRKEAGLIKGGATVSHISNAIGISGDNLKAVSDGKQAASVGKWCKMSVCKENSILQSGFSKLEPSTGRFICYGANGRGGQVKVLKPPRPILEVVGSSLPTLQRQTKRYKGTQSGRHEGGLQIEHFFNAFAS